MCVILSFLFLSVATMNFILCGDKLIYTVTKNHMLSSLDEKEQFKATINHRKQY